MTFPSHPDIDEIKLDQILECCEKQHQKIQELKEALKQKAHRLELAEAESREMRERIERENSLRPSLEVLQRMANGIDPFDIGRFKCAMAALPHEVPKLTASMTMIGAMGIGAKLDAFNAQRRREAERRGLRVIEGEPEPAA